MKITKVERVGVTNDTTFVLRKGLKYRLVDSEAGTLYIKMIPRVGYPRTDPATRAAGVAGTTFITYNDGDASPTNYIVPKYEVYSVSEAELKAYNKVIVNQVVLGAMLLPIKIRPAREFNGIKYERHFATDISVGPFIGYRFKLQGNNYKSFTTLGIFAGPTLVNYVSTTSQTGSQANSVNPDNMFAFTYGLGLVHEINGFQFGVVYGKDRVSGKRVAEWPYDGKGWFSLAIGYNFLAGRTQ